MTEQTSAPGARPRVLINPTVFFVSSALVLAFVLFGVMAPDAASAAFGLMRDWTMESAGWFYVLSVAGFLLFVVILAVSRFGEIKLGPDHSVPDYSYSSWFAMLFSAGMGIGLMSFGVADGTAKAANARVS